MMHLRFLCLLLLLRAAAPLRAQTPAESLEAQYLSAVERIQSRHSARLDTLLTRYRDYLDRLIAEARPRGDIESIAVYLDEKEDPGSQKPTPALELARAALDEQRQTMETARDEELRAIASIYLERLEQQVRDYTRAGDLDNAVAIQERIQAVRNELEGITQTAPDTLEPTQLGPNLLPEGSFGNTTPEQWFIRVPRNTGNRSGFSPDTRAGSSIERNQVLRLQQDDSTTIHFSRTLPIEPGKSYQLSWRTSMARPWRTGIEFRGKGHYRIGFHIGENAFAALPEADQALLDRRAAPAQEPPPDAEWQQHSITLQPGPHMDELLIQASPGEGEILIDDIQVREILPPPPAF